MVPRLRFKDDNGQEFPDWDEKKLGEVANFFSGGTPNSSNQSFYKGDIPFIGSGDIKKKTVNKFITNEALESSSAKIIEKGDLLYALYGATSGQVSISKLRGAINQAVLCIRTDQSNMFLLSVLEYNKERILDKYLQGGQGNLSAKIVKSFIYSFPCLEEQHKIASFLSSVDDKISQLEKKKTLLETYKRGIMQKIFSQELRFKDENGQEFPDWERVRIDSVSECLDNKRKPLNSNQRSKMQGDIPYYGANGVVDYVNDFIFNEDLVLLAEDGGHFDEFLTRPIAQIISGKSWVNNHAHILRANSLISIDFLYYSLVHKDIRKYIVGGGRAKLNKSDLLSIIISLPKLNEQKKIASFLSSIDKKIEITSTQLEMTREFKKGLLQQMFV